MRFTEGLQLILLPINLAVCRLDPDSPIPAWAPSELFFSATRTGDELSVVCPAGSVPQDVLAVRDWRAFMIEGPLDFSLTGVLASLLVPLGSAGIPVFTLSTYDTDYVLVREPFVGRAIPVLEKAGHRVRAA